MTIERWDVWKEGMRAHPEGSYVAYEDHQRAIREAVDRAVTQERCRPRTAGRDYGTGSDETDSLRHWLHVACRRLDELKAQLEELKNQPQDEAVYEKQRRENQELLNELRFVMDLVPKSLSCGVVPKHLDPTMYHTGSSLGDLEIARRVWAIRSRLDRA